MSFADTQRRFPSAIAKVIALVVGLALSVSLAGCDAGTVVPTPNRSLTIGATLEPSSMDAWHDTSAAIPQVLLVELLQKRKPVLLAGVRNKARIFRRK